MEAKDVKIILLVGIALYLISPIDLIPGCPIDDLIIATIGIASMKSRSKGV